MATRIVVPVVSPDGEGGSVAFLVKDNFDEVQNKIAPIQPPTSALEQRANMTFELHPNGERLLIQPGSIVWAQEDYPDE